eukprot:90254-Hanusia_phi.AAC.1
MSSLSSCWSTSSACRCCKSQDRGGGGGNRFERDLETDGVPAARAQRTQQDAKVRGRRRRTQGRRATGRPGTRCPCGWRWSISTAMT